MKSINKEESDSILRHWYWVWIGSGLLVAAMVGYLFFPEIVWLRKGYRGLSLIHEMSYAVWWSGMCLLTASIVFARAGSLALAQKSKSWIWFVMSVAMFALSLDEMGSFHEIVSIMSGWYGLLPFGIIFSVAFISAWSVLIRNHKTRLTAVLIMLGFGGFLSVAGLEYLEHNSSLARFWFYIRWITEEAIELISVALLITAGLVGIKSIDGTDIRFTSATTVVSKILEYPRLITAALVLQVLLTARLFMPKFAFFFAGNPAALFPVILFFCLGILALQRIRNHQSAKFWRFQSALFFLTSATQMYNLNMLFNRSTKSDFQWFLDFPGSWLITVVSFVVLFLYAMRMRYVSCGQLIAYASLFFMTFLIVDPIYWFIEWREYLYLIFSSVVAYFSYLLMREITFKKAGEYDGFDGVSAMWQILKYPFLWFALFVFHIIIVNILIAPNHLEYGDYPAAIFPVVLFFCVGIACLKRLETDNATFFWLTQAAVFLFLSALQLDSFAEVIKSITGVSLASVNTISRSWFILLLPLVLLSSYGLMQKKITAKRLISLVSLLLLVYLFIQPDLKFPYRTEFFYFTFSGVVAYCCYLLIQDIGVINEDAVSS